MEIVVLSLFVGSLGLQATLLGGWMHWQQVTLAQQNEEEEESLTRYDTKEEAAAAGVRPTAQRSQSPQPNGTAKDSSKDPRLTGWEFKIVRAKRDLFRNPATLQRLCQEEAESGWILLEKLDDRRVRFKRPIALRDIIKPEFLRSDPYRSHYGPSSNLTTWLGVTAALVAIFLPAYLAYTLVSLKLSQSRPNAPGLSPGAPASGSSITP